MSVFGLIESQLRGIAPVLKATRGKLHEGGYFYRARGSLCVEATIDKFKELRVTVVR
jgi:hypothetical protein